ncbi:TonB family protein [Massilia aerilata]|uniref:TonB family protein n=1 Tax=Massilia aerilata TaxID=453817 RepID=A0ABW0RTN5_9BURK
MKRTISTFVLAAALYFASGLALAEEAQYKLPTIDFKQCGFPAYPSSALRNSEEGVVFVGLQVDENGAVLDSKILLSSGSAALDQAARQVFHKCRHMPGIVNGQAVTMWMTVQYLWTIDPSSGKTLAKLKQAALEGNAQARYVLSTIIESRAKTDEERAAGLKLVPLAAEAGEPMAQVSLARRYESGKQLPRDLDEARRWYDRAAAQGNVIAIDHLRFIGEAK